MECRDDSMFLDGVVRRNVDRRFHDRAVCVLSFVLFVLGLSLGSSAARINEMTSSSTSVSVGRIKGCVMDRVVAWGDCRERVEMTWVYRQ